MTRARMRAAAAAFLAAAVSAAGAAPASAGIDQCGHGYNSHKHHVAQFYYTEFWQSQAKGYYDKYQSPGYAHFHSYGYFWFANTRRGGSGTKARGCSRSGYGPHSRSRSVADLTGAPDVDMTASTLVGTTPAGNPSEDTGVPVDASGAPGGNLPPDAAGPATVDADPAATADSTVPYGDSRRAKCVRDVLIHGGDMRTCTQ